MHLPLTKKMMMQWQVGNVKERIRAARNNDFGIPQNTEQVVTGIEAQAKKPVVLPHALMMPTKTWWWLRTVLRPLLALHVNCCVLFNSLHVLLVTYLGAGSVLVFLFV